MQLLRHTVRSLAKAPAFFAASVITMALGIAATTALFSVVYSVLLKPLAFPDAGRVVAIGTAWAAKDKATPRVTGGDLMDLRSPLNSFSAVSFYNGGQIGVRVGDRARFARTFQTDASFFHVLRAQPLAGRLPEARDAGQVSVVTESFASANLGGARNAIGRVVVVDNKPYAVIGVVGDAMAYPEKAELWITGPNDPENQNRTAFNYYAIGRIRPDVTLASAQSELNVIAGRSAAAHPDSNAGKTFRVVSLQDELGAPVRPTLLFLFAAAGLLLLISCANVANLMLARAAARTREIAVRVSLGSGVSRVVQLLLAEGAVLGVAAAVLGCVTAYAAIRTLLPFLPEQLPHAADSLHVQPAVLLFAVAASVFTVLACSLLPAIHLGRVNLAELLNQAPTRGFVGGRSTRTRDFIVVAQVALCCTLCVGATLLSRTLLKMIQTPMGFRSEGVLVMYADAPAFELPEYLRAIRTFETALGEIRSLPRVQSAAAVMGLPTGQYGSNGSYLVEGVHIQPGQDIMKMSWAGDLPYATFALASQQYFQTIGVRLLAGRDFSERDQYDAPFTAVVSESLARQSFGTASPIGRRIYCGLDSPNPMTIVGVVSDVRQDSPSSKREPEIYMPFQQHPYHANELQIVVRTTGNAATVVPDVRSRMHRLAPFVATRFTTFSEMVQDSMSAPRFRATLASSFALMALALAVTGVYGLMTYYVTERKAEMSVRMALGATAGSIIRLVSKRAFVLGVSGLLIGLVASVALHRVVGSMLYGVRTFDPVTYVLCAGVVLAVVFVGGLAPAWRASRLDPIQALRDS